MTLEQNTYITTIPNVYCGGSSRGLGGEISSDMVQR